MQGQEEIQQIHKCAAKLQEILSEGQKDIFDNPLIPWALSRPIVEMVLDQFPKSRDNETYGIDMFIHMFKETYKTQIERKQVRLPDNPYETWRRLRQKFQERREYDSTPEVKEARRKKELWMRENVKYI